MLTLIDEYTRESLAIRVDRKLRSIDVIETLTDAMLVDGIPEHIRSYNGPEFVAVAVRKWLRRLGTKPLYIEPGSPWENAFVESFNSKLRDECLNEHVFFTLAEARETIEAWRFDYNHCRPHSSLGALTPTEFAMLKGPQEQPPLEGQNHDRLYL
jgi:putative transposase